jgi:hypothetical protein
MEWAARLIGAGRAAPAGWRRRLCARPCWRVWASPTNNKKQKHSPGLALQFAHPLISSLFLVLQEIPPDWVTCLLGIGRCGCVWCSARACDVGWAAQCFGGGRSPLLPFATCCSSSCLLVVNWVVLARLAGVLRLAAWPVALLSAAVSNCQLACANTAHQPEMRLQMRIRLGGPDPKG